ncbi:hypothetical protein [Streptomyces atratus]|uniref:hypothetical protein n=1 Tax=Streptomyces atratus TaxID=1893 RepID=UPI001300B99C
MEALREHAGKQLTGVLRETGGTRRARPGEPGRGPRRAAGQGAWAWRFDAVLPADPAAVLGRPARGLNDLYVALTPATQRLGIVHEGPAPEVLAATVTERS